MLSIELRPKIWDEIVGQEENTKILKALIKNPDSSPRTLIFSGDFGSGKTTSARILARELNGVKDPNYDLSNSPFYFEYDSTVIGNVAEIKKLRDTFSEGYENYWKVIVFDEVHAVSQQAQTALLKVLEETTSKTIYCLCTTHVHKVLPTIRSRSLELDFGRVSMEAVITHLDQLEGRLNISLPKDIKSLVAYKSHGHMRNVHMLVDKYLLIGEADFKATVVSSLTLFCEFFRAIKSDNSGDVLKCINGLLKLPLWELENDFGEFIISCTKCLQNLPISNLEIESLVKLYGSDLNKLVRCYFNEWVRSAFISEVHFHASMLYFYTIMKSEVATSSPTPTGTQGRMSAFRPAVK